MSANEVTQWWDVVNAAGLPGFLFALVIGVVWFVKKYAPAFMGMYNRHIIALEKQNELMDSLDAFIKEMEK